MSKRGYVKALWADAFGTTWSEFVDHFGKPWLIAYYTVAALPIYVWLGAVKDVPAELSAWGHGLIAIVGATALLIIGRLVTAPCRIWRRDQKTIAALIEERADRRNYEEIGKEIEVCIRQAMVVIALGPMPDFDFSDWATRTQEAVSKLGHEERMLFETTVLFQTKNGEIMLISDHLAEYVATLRDIAARAFAKADGKHQRQSPTE